MNDRREKILYLTLKKKWFDMIVSGEKREEYRGVTDYWMIRLAGIKGCGTSYNFTLLCNKGNKCREYDFVVFRNGYSKTSPQAMFECKGITVRQGKARVGHGTDFSFKIKNLGVIYEKIKSTNKRCCTFIA